jgi:predicted ATPase
MIKSVKISNFKSVVDLSMELGSFNVLIGENGSGKSNILEALAFGAAASADKLDNEFLGSRGIRVTKPDFMFSAFENGKKKKPIIISLAHDQRVYNYNLVIDLNNPKKWVDFGKEKATAVISNLFMAFLESDNSKKDKFLSSMKDNMVVIPDLVGIFNSFKDDNDYRNFFSEYNPSTIEKLFSHPDISNYIVYSPEQSSLRKFEETTQIYPLGVKGEGLFQYLKELAYDKTHTKIIKEIKENLALLDWYEDFELPKNLLQNEFALNIKDRYLDINLQYFDQRSTNEGFLFLLFYSTLFISKTTPAFFAIDNIDASFNPKLCSKIIQTMAELAKKKKKQVIVTTHNPAVLDGLNLKDGSQRLFVVSRNMEGHTRARRIEYKVNRTISISEAWRKGLIGGLPDNF